MASLIGMLGVALDLLLVVLGFSFIIFIHELGHFLAARWAGIRVLGFAVGFGSAVLSYRKGLGIRRGSSEPDYRAWVDRETLGRGLDAPAPAGISPTEYRLNWLPFGGYVKMLGQEDANPEAVSAAPDSYQNCAPWRRLIVISAGVIANVILAAVLFVIVFLIGIPNLPATIGDVEPGSAASRVVARNAAKLGVEKPGLQAMDELLFIDGEKPESFNDLMLATSMASRGRAIELVVRRGGVEEPLEFAVTPEVGRLTGLLEIGVEPARSATLVPPGDDETANAKFVSMLAARGLAGVEPGMTLVRAGGRNVVASAADFVAAFRESGGNPVELAFTSVAGKTIVVTSKPTPELQEDLVAGSAGAMSPIDHLLGLVPVMMVADEEVAQGLERGDIFARIGAVEFPNLAQGMAEIKGYARRELDLEVLRAGPSGDGLVRVKLKVKVNGKGQIGFRATHTGERGTWVSLPPRELTEIRDKASPRVPAAMTLIDKPGTKVVRVGDRDVASFGAMREALQRAILAAMDGGVSSENAGIAISVTLDLPGEVQTRRDVVWNIPAMDAKEILALGYGPSVSTGIFEPEEFLQVARTPGEALGKGLHETKRVMITTYITFARLFEGTVKIEHLKGPVGIAHLGTMIADRGVIWLVFFMALISVNLAVVNFLPLPIVDGGQFLFILFEAIRGRPVPIRIQSIATFMGLAMIGCMFLLVTFNDLKRLIGM